MKSNPNFTDACQLLTGEQCREARRLLKWSRDRLAPLAEMPITRLGSFENKTRELFPEEIARLRKALEAAGVVFTNGSEPGVKLCKSAD